MQRSFSISSLVILSTLLGGLAGSGCSDDSGPMLYVDVSLAGVAAPAKVELEVLQGQTPLATKTYIWPAGASVLKAGVGLPKGASGTVAIVATGYDSDGGVVALGTTEGAIGSDVLSVVLQPLVPVVDGGVDGPPPAGDAAPVDLAVDRTPGVDGSIPDGGTPDVVAPVDRVGRETPPTDDGPPDVARDVPLDLDGPGPDGPGPGDVVVAEVSARDGEGDAGDTGSDGAGTQRSWSTPTQVDPDGSSAFGVAMDPVTGNAVVVWSDSLTGVKARRYTAASDAWSPAVTLASDIDINAAKVAVDAKGHYLAVWSVRGQGTDATAPGLWAGFSTDGASWSKPTQLFAGGAKNYDEPESLRIAMNRNGQAMVLWDHFQSPYSIDTLHELRAAYVEGTANQTATLLGSQSYAYEAGVAIDENGNGIIAWADEAAAQSAIMAATFVKQTVATPTSVRSDSDGDVGYPDVAMNAAGQGIVVWAKRVPSSSGYVEELWSRRYSATGSWAADAELVVRASAAGTLKSVVLDKYGTANVAWSRTSGPAYQCTVSTQTLGGTWSTQGLETDNLATSRYSVVTEPEPVAALDGSGDLLVGWRKKISDTEYAPNLRWRTDDTWATVEQIGMVPDLFSSDMKVAAADDGRAVAAWYYYHCDPGWSEAEYVCPTAKDLDELSAESTRALWTVYVSVYR